MESRHAGMRSGQTRRRAGDRVSLIRLAVEQGGFGKGKIAELRRVRPLGIFAPALLRVPAENPPHRAVCVEAHQKPAAARQEAAHIAGEALDITDLTAIEQTVDRHGSSDMMFLEDKRIGLRAFAHDKAQATKAVM